MKMKLRGKDYVWMIILAALYLVCVALGFSATVTYTPPVPPAWQSTAGGWIAQSSDATTVISDGTDGFTVRFSRGALAYHAEVFGVLATDDGYAFESLGAHSQVSPTAGGSTIDFTSCATFSGGIGTWRFISRNDGFSKELILSSSAEQVFGPDWDAIAVGGYLFSATDSAYQMIAYADPSDATGTPIQAGETVDAWRIGWTDATGALDHWIERPAAYTAGGEIVGASTWVTDSGLFFVWHDWQDIVRFDPSITVTGASAFSVKSVNTGDIAGNPVLGGEPAQYYRIYWQVNWASILPAGAIITGASLQVATTPSASAPSGETYSWCLPVQSWDTGTINWSNKPANSDSLGTIASSALSSSGTNTLYLPGGVIDYANGCLAGNTAWQRGFVLQMETEGYRNPGEYYIFWNGASGNPYHNLNISYILPNFRGNTTIKTTYSPYQILLRDTDSIFCRLFDVNSILGATSEVESSTPFYIALSAPSGVALATMTSVTSFGDNYQWSYSIPATWKALPNFDISVATAKMLSQTVPELWPWKSSIEIPNASSSVSVDTAEIAAAVAALSNWATQLTAIASADAANAVRVQAVTLTIAEASAAQSVHRDAVITAVADRIDAGTELLSTAIAAIDLSAIESRIDDATAYLAAQIAAIVVDLTPALDRIDSATGYLNTQLQTLGTTIGLTQIQNGVSSRIAFATAPREPLDASIVSAVTDVRFVTGEIAAYEATWGAYKVVHYANRTAGGKIQSLVADPDAASLEESVSRLGYSAYLEVLE